MASIELLDRLRAGYRPPVEMVEHTPSAELVSPVDVVRQDELGRQVVVCPAGQPPHSRLTLTAEERASLVPPPDPPPDGFLEPGHCGFTPRNTRVGYTIDNGGPR